MSTRRAILLWVCLMATRGAFADELRAAFISCDITPPPGLPMAGYAERKAAAESVHDSLLAGLLTIEEGDERVAIISLDLIGIESTRIIEEYKEAGYTRVILACSHTHSGPPTDASPDGLKARAWLNEAEEKIIAMARDTHRRPSPVTVRAGQGETWLGHNRRLVGPDGKVTMFWSNPERKPTHPLDPTVSVVRFDNPDGSPAVVFVHFACHAVVLGPDNLAYSADYPGAMRARLGELLNRRVGHPVPVFFLQGAAGDINPYMQGKPVKEGGFDEVKRLGGQLADEAMKVFGQLEKRPPLAGSLRVTEDDLTFKERWDETKTLQARVTTMLLGEDLGIAFVPGEPFVDFQLDLSARAPVESALLVGYAMCAPHLWPGYLPTIEAATQGGYGASYGTKIEVGAGETMVDRAVIGLYKLKGILDPPKPGAKP